MTIIEGDQLIIREKVPDKVVISEFGPQAAHLLREMLDVDVTGEQIGNVLVLIGFDSNNRGLYGFADVATDVEVAAAVEAHRIDTTDVHGIADTSALVLTNDPRLSDVRHPNGPAGGVLAGNYPSPDFAVDMATQVELGTTVGASSLDVNGHVVLSFTTSWGVRSDGTPYFDPNGAAVGEERVLVVGPDGSINLVQPGG